MVRCNAMSVLVDEEESATAGASSASAGVTNMPMPMMRCIAISWTDKEAGRLRVLVTRRDLVTGTVTVTEEQTVQRAHFTGTVAEKRFMESKWCEKLWQAMLRVDKRKHIATNGLFIEIAKKKIAAQKTALSVNSGANANNEDTDEICVHASNDGSTIQP